MAEVVKLNPGYYADPSIDRPVSNGSIYVGKPDLDPEIEANQKQVTIMQENGTLVEVSQPIYTGSGGVPEYLGSAVTLLVDSPYSIKVLDSHGAQKYYIPTSTGFASGESIESVDDLRDLTLTPNDGEVVPLLGYYTEGDGGGQDLYWDAASTETDNGGTIFKITTITTGRFKSIIPDIVSSKQFGAYADNSTNDTTLIQNAIDYLNSLTSGGILNLSPGVSLLQVGGTQDSIDYGLMVKSNVTISGSPLSVLKQDINQNMVVLTDDRSTQTENISLYGFKIDGNSSNNTGSDLAFNLWFKNSDNLRVDNVYSYDSASFGMRFDSVTNSMFGVLRVKIEADGRDGVHFYDSNTVSIDKVIIDTAGDDGFIITAQDADTHDIAVGELVVTAPVTGIAAGRGILLNLADTAEAAGTQRNIYNINISSAVIYNCKGPALNLTFGNFYNINVGLTDYGSKYGLNIVIGSSNVTGAIKNSIFDISSYDATNKSVEVIITDGSIEHNKLNLLTYNPGDTVPGATIRGDYWHGDININYDPEGSKASPSFGVDLFTTYSNFKISTEDGTRGVNLRGTATNNTLNIGSILNASTSSIEIAAGGDNNKFIGGTIDNSVVNSATGTMFVNVTGANSYGAATSLTPDSNGNATIAHGLVGTPIDIQLTLRGDNNAFVDVQTADATNITVRFKDGTGADITTGSYFVYYEASL